MKQYAKIISDTQIEFAPKDFNGISNWINDETLVKAEGYKEFISITPPEPFNWYEVHYEERDSKIYETYLERKNLIDEIKTSKYFEINQARDKMEQGGFEYLGKIFDSDQISCIRMMGARDALALAPEGTTIVWTCQDNSNINLNYNQLVELVMTLANWSNTCHQKASELKKQVEKAESIEEINNIKW